MAAAVQSAGRNAARLPLHGRAVVCVPRSLCVVSSSHMDLLSSFDSNPSSAVLTYKATIEEIEHCLFLKNPAMRVPFR